MKRLTRIAASSGETYVPGLAVGLLTAPYGAFVLVEEPGPPCRIVMMHEGSQTIPDEAKYLGSIPTEYGVAHYYALPA